MNVNDNIKRIRKALGLTLEELALRTHLTKGYLSKVENARKSPPISTLQNLAVALGVDLSELLEGQPSKHPQPDGLDIIKAGGKGETNRKPISTGKGYSYIPYVQSVKNKYMSPFLMVIPQGQTGAFSHDSEEFCYIVSGNVDLEYEGKTYSLETGDGFYLDSRKPHKLINSKKEPANILAVNFNYRRF